MAVNALTHSTCLLSLSRKSERRNTGVHTHLLFFEFFDDAIPKKLSRVLHFCHIWSRLFLQRRYEPLQL